MADDEEVKAPVPTAGTFPRVFAGLGAADGQGGELLKPSTIDTDQISGLPPRIHLAPGERVPLYGQINENRIIYAELREKVIVSDGVSAIVVKAGIPETGLYEIEITKDNVISTMQERIAQLERFTQALSLSISVSPIGHNNPPEPIGSDKAFTTADLNQIRYELALLRSQVVAGAPSKEAKEAVGNLKQIGDKLSSLFSDVAYDAFSAYVKQLSVRAADFTVYGVAGIILVKTFGADLITLASIGEAWLRLLSH